MAGRRRESASLRWDGRRPLADVPGRRVPKDPLTGSLGGSAPFETLDLLAGPLPEDRYTSLITSAMVNPAKGGPGREGLNRQVPQVIDFQDIEAGQEDLGLADARDVTTVTSGCNGGGIDGVVKSHVRIQFLIRDQAAHSEVVLAGGSTFGCNGSM